MRRALALAGAALVAACVHVDPREDADAARALIELTTGRADAFDPALEPVDLDAVLTDGLTLAEAERLALAHDRALQAAFHRLGVAQAERVQAGLFANPSLEVLLRLPLDGGRALLEAGLGFGLAQLWQVPAREDVARAELAAEVLRVARLGAERLAAARGAYFEAVAADGRVALAREAVALAERSSRSIDELRAQGAADALDAGLARGPLVRAGVELDRARADAADARRALAAELSIERALEDLALPSALPLPTAADRDPEALVALALAARLDLRALDATLAALAARLESARARRFGDVELGLSYERPEDGGSGSLGPALGVELPLFDRGEASVAAAEHELLRLRAARDAAAARVAQDVRTAAGRLATARRALAAYATQLVPDLEASLALARESHAEGTTPLATVLEFQRQLLEARGLVADLRLDAATAAADLERAVGAPLAVRSP